MWLCGCVKSCQGEGESSEVGGGDCVSAEAAAQPIGVVVGGRWDTTIYYCIIYTIAHYCLLLTFGS